MNRIALENEFKLKFAWLVQGDSEGLGLGYGDLDFGSSLGWWAATIATYCPSSMMEHLIPISTQPRSDSFWVSMYNMRVKFTVPSNLHFAINLTLCANFKSFSFFPFQTISGTGGLRLGAEFLNKFFPGPKKVCYI